MPRPFTKEQILAASQKEHDQLVKLISTLTPDRLNAPGQMSDWSIKDILCHLTAWEQMVLRWLAEGQQGLAPQVPAPGYKWNQLPALNQNIYETHHDLPLEEVLSQFHDSYSQVMAVIETLPPETLFTPGLYPWMNKNVLASYFVSCTSSHYHWAIKEIKKGLH
jgi:hypothetical protein